MIAVGVFFLYAYALWIMFLCVMSLRWQWNSLPKFVKLLAFPAVFFAFAMDLIFNIAVSPLFLELPREATFSQRMGRYKYGDSKIKASIARWICANLLDPFQIGGHCK